jgi:hypothetical protein
MASYIQTNIIPPVQTYVRKVFDFWNQWESQGTNWEATTRNYEDIGE